MTMRYLSLFSGIGGMDLGFDRARIVCAGQVEFDAKARSVLARHWPDVPRMNDVREVQGDEFGAIDLICGGFPCQDVSVAGRREGLAGERSGLWFSFRDIVDRVRPRWVVVENVPGLLSSNGGRDFAVVLRGLVECGYGVAWRILDAQYFGVPQRRRRVFIVASLGRSGRAAEVLFERESGGGDSEAGRKARPGLAAAAGRRTNGAGPIPFDLAQITSGVNRTTVRADGPAWPLNTSAQAHVVTHALTTESHATGDGVGCGVPIVTTTFNDYTGGADDNDAQGGHLVATPLRAEGHDASEDGTGRQNLVTVAFTERGRSDGLSLEMQEELAYALTNPGAGSRTTCRNIAGAFGVRRLTPVECERLQGFPDNWTAYGADGPQSDSARYRQLGNAVAVPVAEWLGRRIVAAEMENAQ